MNHQYLPGAREELNRQVHEELIRKAAEARLSVAAPKTGFLKRIFRSLLDRKTELGIPAIQPEQGKHRKAGQPEAAGG